ncbi:MAG: cyclic nucleotide-binding domain-containing protein [Dehalococcoidia bacterium]
MTTTHGPHVTDLTRHFSMCQEFPEEHIQCLLPGSCEGAHSPGDVIVKCGSSPEGVYIILEGTARVVYSVATPPAPRWAVIDLVGAGRLFSLASILDGDSYIAQLEAMNQTRTLYVPRELLLEEIREHREAA